MRGDWCPGGDFNLSAMLFGAGNEARTRDLNLGKVALYQLSYSRIAERRRHYTDFCLGVNTGVYAGYRIKTKFLSRVRWRLFGVLYMLLAEPLFCEASFAAP